MENISNLDGIDNTEALFSEPCQISKKDRFAKIVSG